jgi:hypothetical protein
VGKAPTGLFTGKMGRIAIMTTSGWVFSPVPRQGQKVYCANDKINYIYRNTWWNKVLSEKKGARYQDFRDVPDGQDISLFTIASGNSQGPTGVRDFERPQLCQQRAH